MGSNIVSKYKVGMEGKEIEWFMSCGERQFQRGEGSEKWAEVGDLFATIGHGAVQA